MRRARVVKESVGALPTHVFAPGTYTVSARNGGEVFQRTFTVQAGDGGAGRGAAAVRRGCASPIRTPAWGEG